MKGAEQHCWKTDSPEQQRAAAWRTGQRDALEAEERQLWRTNVHLYLHQQEGWKTATHCPQLFCLIDGAKQSG